LCAMLSLDVADTYSVTQTSAITLAAQFAGSTFYYNLGGEFRNVRASLCLLVACCGSCVRACILVCATARLGGLPASCVRFWFALRVLPPPSRTRLDSPNPCGLALFSALFLLALSSAWRCRWASLAHPRATGHPLPIASWTERRPPTGQQATRFAARVCCLHPASAVSPALSLVCAACVAGFFALRCF
jgi:hypothetical protein